MISNIQILRGLAALGVAFYHTGYVIPATIHSDFLGVPVFFVISGFIMTHITRETDEGFLLHRLIRIVPLYWIASAIYAGLVVVIYPLIGKSSDNIVTASSLLRDFFFFPRFDGDGHFIFPVLNVGWTLNLEMWFYLLFAVALTVNRRFAPVMVAMAVAAFWSFGQSLPNALAFYAHEYVIFFSLGIAIYYVANLTVGKPAATGTASTLVGVAALVYFVCTGSHAASLIAPPLIVLGGVLLEHGRVACRYHLALALGSSSYALYLCHSFFTGAFREFAKRVASFDTTSHLPAALLAVAASAVASWLIFVWIERPLLKTLRLRVDISRGQTRADTRSTCQSGYGDSAGPNNGLPNRALSKK